MLVLLYFSRFYFSLLALSVNLLEYLARKHFPNFIILPTKTHFLYSYRCFQLNWYHGTWNTFCRRSTCLHRCWRAAITPIWTSHQYASVGQSRSPWNLSYFSYLLNLFTYITAVPRASSRRLSLHRTVGPVCTSMFHLEALHRVSFSCCVSLVLCYLVWFYISAPRWLCFTRPSGVRDTPQSFSVSAFVL